MAFTTVWRVPINTRTLVDFKSSSLRDAAVVAASDACF